MNILEIGNGILELLQVTEEYADVAEMERNRRVQLGEAQSNTGLE